MRSRAPIALLGALAALVTPATVRADVALEATLQREWALPLGFDPLAASLGSNRDGLVWLASTSGVEGASTCVVVVADADGARAVQLRPREIPSQCVGVDVDADGRVLARLLDPTADPTSVRGATVAVDTDGAILWEVYDDDLIDAQPASDGGTGAFQGVYDSPASALAWSVELDRALAFTASAFELGQIAQPLTLAHVVDGERAELDVSGLGFGPSGLGVVSALTVRPEDGHFVAAVEPQSALEESYSFVSYDGRRGLDGFDPLSAGAFRGRVPVALTAAVGLRLHILWTEGPEAGADAGLTTVDDQGRGFLDVDLPQSRSVAGEPTDLGRPLGLWTDGALAWILHDADGVLFVRLVTLDEGEDWGVAPLGSVTRQIPLGLAYVGPDQVGLITRDAANSRINAWTLSATDLPDVPDTGAEEGDADAGFPLDGGIPPIDIPDAGEVLCGCRQTPGSPVPWSGVTLVALLVLGARRRAAQA